MYAVPDIDKEETLGYSSCEAPPNPPDITKTTVRYYSIYKEAHDSVKVFDPG